MNLQEVAAQLIKFRTETGNMREIERCMNFIRQQAEPLGAEVEIYRKDALAPVILLSNGKYRDFDVLVVGHIDVVPAADPMFVPYVKEGKMFGRGSLDMKSFAAVGLNSLEYVLKQQLPLKFGVCCLPTKKKAVSDWKPFYKTIPTSSPKSCWTSTLPAISEKSSPVAKVRYSSNCSPRARKLTAPRLGKELTPTNN